MPQAWTELQVTLGEVSYPFYFGSNCTDRILAALAQYDADRFIVVSDDTVLATHGEALLPGLGKLARPIVCSTPAGEAMKRHDPLFVHLEKAIAEGATRRSVVVAFGGGVPGNVGGLVAALLFRGIRLVHIPTTLIAAMDSVISLKQAINSTFGKNQIGTFYVPSAVFVDTDFFHTLSPREIRSGLCEVAKNCLAIRPQALPSFRDLLRGGNFLTPGALQWLLTESLLAKSAVMSQDARECGGGLVLEYGHTVGHAIEFCDQRASGPDSISHGDAVALGMLVAANVSASLGILDAQSKQVHDEIVAALGVRAQLPRDVGVDDVMQIVRHDNKRGYLPLSPREIAMVLLKKLGAPLGDSNQPLVPVALDKVESAISDLFGGFAQAGRSCLLGNIEGIAKQGSISDSIRGKSI